MHYPPTFIYLGIFFLSNVLFYSILSSLPSPHFLYCCAGDSSFFFVPSQHQNTIVKMSSPARRSTRNSRQPSSPAPGPSNGAGNDASQTPRRSTRASQLASSPMFYDGSSPANANAAPSSPLRQMSNSQSTDNGPAPSSPLRQQSETQSVHDGDRTPRASGLAIGGRFPIT